MGGFEEGNSEWRIGNSYSLLPIAYCLNFLAASAAK